MFIRQHFSRFQPYRFLSIALYIFILVWHLLFVYHWLYYLFYETITESIVNWFCFPFWIPGGPHIDFFHFELWFSPLATVETFSVLWFASLPERNKAPICFSTSGSLYPRKALIILASKRPTKKGKSRCTVGTHMIQSFSVVSSFVALASFSSSVRPLVSSRQTHTMSLQSRPLFLAQHGLLSLLVITLHCLIGTDPFAVGNHPLLHGWRMQLGEEKAVDFTVDRVCTKH